MLGGLDAKKQKELIFVLIVLAAAYFSCKKIWKIEEAQFNLTKNKVNNFQKQIKLAEDIQGLTKEMAQFNQAGWETSNSVVIMGKINEIARKYNVDILTFDPGQARELKYYSVFSMGMTIESTYSTFLKFLAELEQLRTYTKIVSVQVRTTGRVTEEGPNINVVLTLEAYTLKKES